LTERSGEAKVISTAHAMELLSLLPDPRGLQGVTYLLGNEPIGCSFEFFGCLGMTEKKTEYTHLLKLGIFYSGNLEL
jgi:hypothetical protein